MSSSTGSTSGNGAGGLKALGSSAFARQRCSHRSTVGHLRIAPYRRISAAMSNLFSVTTG